MQSLDFSKMWPVVILAAVIAGSFGHALKIPPPIPDPRIVGGVEADIRHHPYQLSLQTVSHICGASIIDSKWVVTAAHCAKFPPNEYNVSAGSNDKYRGTYYGVRRIIRHPKYNPSTIDYDIALLEIDGQIEFNESVKPVKLAEAELPSGTLVNVTGWGAVKQGGGVSSYLMKVSIPIVDRETCQGVYHYMNDVTDRMICAGFVGDGGKDSCQGDSGGPLTANGTLYGIVSWGFGCAQPNYPGVYGNVANFRSWIKEISEI